MMTSLSEAALRLPKRAESSDRDKLIETFVDVGPLFALLSSSDHQVLFGRRGTGKTHALSYLADKRQALGDAVVMVDLRNVGSSGGIYSDETVSLPERATRLLVDTLSAIHEGLYEFFVEHAESLNLSIAGPALDVLAEAITQVKVVGQIEKEERTETETDKKKSSGAGIEFRSSGITAKIAAAEEKSVRASDSNVIRYAGDERLYVNFGTTGTAFRKLTELLKGKRLWVLLDEWSSIPIALQPYLADLIRRSLFPVPNATVKLGAIEQRTAFRATGASGGYIGIELGADASADVNLDDFMVFDNDAERAKDFYEALIARHIRAILHESDSGELASASDAGIMSDLFTEKRAIEEFVRACEGVPRDAINILSLAAQRASQGPISVQHVRVAARNWYQRDKEKAASANERAHQLLHWVMDEVIGERRARAFLLRTDVNDELINALYDARVLHILKRAISTHDQPGIRYDVYKLDYGCYVDLITTAKAPQGLLPGGSDKGERAHFVDVPPDDYRSIRRAILDLSKFYAVDAS